MSLIYEQRLSDSRFVETITHGRAVSNGSAIRPAEVNWHMVFVRHASHSSAQTLFVGPWTMAGPVSWGGGAEILWIKFRLGAFMPHFPTGDFRDVETNVPGAASHSFWLKGSAWEFPDYDNVETFVDRLVREEVLALDPIVSAASRGQFPEMPSRTVRHRFLRAAGVSQSHIFQVERARRAEALLKQGVSILDTVHALGYFDQPHLTRSLKQLIGYTPAQILRMSSLTLAI